MSLDDDFFSGMQSPKNDTEESMPNDIATWELAMANSKYIVKIQSLYRGFRDRKLVRHLKKS